MECQSHNNHHLLCISIQIGKAVCKQWMIRPRRRCIGRRRYNQGNLGSSQLNPGISQALEALKALKGPQLWLQPGLLLWLYQTLCSQMQSKGCSRTICGKKIRLFLSVSYLSYCQDLSIKQPSLCMITDYSAPLCSWPNFLLYKLLHPKVRNILV